MTPLKPVTSAAMRAYGYDLNTQTLAIQFGPTDKVTLFAGVPPEVGVAFDAAESKGKFFGASIKTLPFDKFEARTNKDADEK
jgi:hypothetical protein